MGAANPGTPASQAIPSKRKKTANTDTSARRPPSTMRGHRIRLVVLMASLTRGAVPRFRDRISAVLQKLDWRDRPSGASAGLTGQGGVPKPRVFGKLRARKGVY